MKIIDKKKLAIVILDENIEVFVVCIAFSTSKMMIHPTWAAQKTLLMAEKMIILAEYLNFAYIFSKKIIAELPKGSNNN